MCIDCGPVSKCPLCGLATTNQHEYKDGRRWQCCGELVNPVTTSKPARKARSKDNV